MQRFDSLADEIAHEKRERRKATFTNRQFVTAVRAELAAAGRPDIAFERTWFDEDTPDHQLIVHVPVAAELIVPLRAMARYFEMRTADDLKQNATEFAKALVNLKLAETSLVKYARDVRRAANTAVAAARAEGLDILLERVGFKPTLAYHLTSSSWKDAASHVLAEVTVRHTSFYHRPDTLALWVEEPADVAEELSKLIEDQRERQARSAELDARGADLVVDAITIDLLAAHGLDACEIITQVWKQQCVNLKVDYLGEETLMSLVSGHGQVTASVGLPEGFWNGEYLWFTKSERDADHQHLVGKSLGDLMPHPAFTGRAIVSVEKRHIDHISFDLSDKFLFDGDTGRLWREERLAA